MQNLEGEAHIRRLVILHNTAQRPFRRTQRPIEHVHVTRLGVLALVSQFDIQRPALVVGTVGARHEFLVFPLVREPRFEVVLDRSGIIETARDDVDDAVRDLEGFVECTRDVDHLL